MHSLLQEQVYCDFAFKQRGVAFLYRPVMNFQNAETSDSLNIQQDVGCTGILFTSLNNIASCIIFRCKKLSRSVTTWEVVGKYRSICIRLGECGV